MQVFKCFFKIVRQNLNLIIMYAAIFMVLTLAFSSVGGQQQSQFFTESKVPVAVVDNDRTETSSAIQALLDKHHTLVSLEGDRQALQDALYNREVEYILFIPDGYEAAFLAGEGPTLEVATIPNSYTGAYVDRLINRFVATAGTYIAAGQPASSALANAEADLSKEADVTMTHEEARNMPSVYYFYNYLPYSLMLMMIFGLCPVLMIFGSKNIAMRMNSSALPIGRRNLGLIGGSAVFSAVCFAALIAFGFIMYGSDMLIEGALLCLANAACFLLVAAALAFLIGHLAKSANMLSAISNVIGLGFCFMGGIFVPLEIMGAGMQTVAKFMPTYWYVNALDIASQGSVSASGFSEIWQSMGVQALFALAFFAAALVLSKKNQQIA
ncbi:MAG: ABC transporter permease [Christensenellaceae bacterium]|jgi:ABC-2 type transport system permease protein